MSEETETVEETLEEKLSRTVEMLTRRMENLEDMLTSKDDQIKAKDTKIKALEEQLSRPAQLSVKSGDRKSVLDSLSPGEIIILARQAGLIKI
jgi:chromosome segregation ATPase